MSFESSGDRAPGRMGSMSEAEVCFRKLGEDNRGEEDGNGSGETTRGLWKESREK